MLIGYLLIVGFVLFDQLFKILSIVFSNNVEGLIKVIIPNVFEFHYLLNPGASFGIGEGQQLLFSLVTVVALIIFGYFFLEIDFKKKKVLSFAVVLLISGTFGNAIDRIFRPSGVVDMINMPILNNILSIFKIPGFIFNIADLYMTIGVILFAIDLLFLERKRVDINEEN